MRAVYTLYFLLFYFGFSVAQENTNKLLSQAENSIFSDPQEAIRIGEYISNKSQNKSDILDASYVMMRSYYIQGNYDKALTIGFSFSKENFENENDTKLKMNVLLSRILKELELNELASSYMKKAIEASKKTINDSTEIWFKGKSIQNDLSINAKEDIPQKIKELKRIKNMFKTSPSIKNSFQMGLIDLEIATNFLREVELDSVQYYLESAYKESKKAKPGNFLEMKYLSEYGNYLFLKRDHKVAIDSLRSALTIAEKLSNIPAQLTISEALADNYLAVGNRKEFNIQNKNTQTLATQSDNLENAAVNTAFNFVNDNQTESLSSSEKYLRNNIYLFGSGLILVLLFWVGLAYRYRVKIKEYQSFMDFFQRKQKAEPIIIAKEKVLKQTVVPKEMEEILLQRLEDFENSTDFTNQDTSLSRLALQFDTNTKYLSEIVNSHKEKNFNTYINELRINYIIDKLNFDPTYLQYKISYLAEDSGFSSHSVFATVFKQVTGISPTRFITILKDKKEEANAKAS